MNIKKAVPGYGGPIIFVASGYLGTASVFTVDGIGRGDVMVEPSAIADIERSASGEAEAICSGEKMLITQEAELATYM